MRASASTTAFRHSPWTPALAQFRPKSKLGARRAALGAYSDGPFARRTEPSAAPAEISFGLFRLLPTQFLLLERDQPVPLGSRARRNPDRLA